MKLKEKTTTLVICNGMKRSGSTLQYNLVSSMVEKSGMGVSAGFYTHKEFQNQCAYLIDRYQSSRYIVIKAHEPLYDILDGEGVSFVILTCHRDLRDVYLSGKNKWNWDESNLVDSLDEVVNCASEVESQEVVLAQSYEELTTSINGKLREIADFLEIDISDSSLSNICSENSIENVKRKIEGSFFRNLNILINQELKRTPLIVKRLFRRIGITNMIRGSVVPYVYVDKNTNLHSNHISENNGTIGKWKDQLSSFEIKKIEHRYGTFMKQRGYSLSASEEE